MKVMVIGGCGAIGSNLVQALAEKNEVLVLDNLSSGRLENITGIDCDFEYCDISDIEKTRYHINSFRPNLLFNLAAHFANQNSVDYPFSDINTNIIGLVNTLECCNNLRSLKKYIYASSSCIYGESLKMSENENVCPHETPYAINKYVGELYTKYYSSHFGIPAVSGRIFNTYGPKEPAGKYRNVIPNFIQSAINNRELVITGSGEECRDFTYVSDTSSLLILLAQSNFKNGEVFNAGTGRPIKISELAREIISLCGSSSKVKYVERRSWDSVSMRVSDISRSATMLGYEPRVSIKKGLKKTIEWHKSLNENV